MELEGSVYCKDCIHKGLVFHRYNALPSCCLDGLTKKLLCGYFQKKEVQKNECEANIT